MLPAAQAGASVTGLEHPALSGISGVQASGPGSAFASERASHTEQLYHTFSRKHPDFKKEDANSKFTAQVTFSSGLPMAWSFELSPPLQAVAISNMDCHKYILEGSCKFKVDIDGQTGTATVSFEFHWEIVR